MAWRWAGTILLEAEKGFRRLKGYQGMPALLANPDRLVDQKEAAG